MADLATSASFDLAVPPSVNALYANVPGRGRIKSKAYKSWKRGELKALIAQRARPVATPVSISILLPATMRGDLDGRCKATIDLIVRAGIIPDDSKKYVRSVTINFHAEKTARVLVSSVADSNLRSAA